MIKIPCFSCGEELEIDDGLEKIACPYCGSELLINRGEGAISFKAASLNNEEIEIDTKDSTDEEELTDQERQERKIKDIGLGCSALFFVLFVGSLVIKFLFARFIDISWLWPFMLFFVFISIFNGVKSMNNSDKIDNENDEAE